jgi:hypothetical protein
MDEEALHYSSLFQLPDQPKMMPCRKNIHDHSRCDERRSEPYRQPKIGRGKTLNELELLQEEPKTGPQQN